MQFEPDLEAWTIHTRIIHGLRSARIQANRSQRAVAENLALRPQTVCEWECDVVAPLLPHLIQWCDDLDRRLVLVDRDGNLPRQLSRRRPGETWVRFERRRLASPLRGRRLAIGMSQGKLGQLVGVSRDSISRWEVLRTPPRTIAHVVWAQQLGYMLTLAPILTPAAQAVPRQPGGGFQQHPPEKGNTHDHHSGTTHGTPSGRAPRPRRAGL